MWRRSLLGCSMMVLATLTQGLSPAGAVQAPMAPSPPAVSRVASTPGGARWPWPIAPPIVMGRTFAAPATPYAAGHRGVDLVVAAGSEVRSPADGVVTFAGVVVDRSVVTLDVGDDLLVSFEPLEAAVVKGAPVARGALIGHASEGGHCGTECLHVGVRLRGEYISPLLFFDRVPRAVLLPLK